MLLNHFACPLFVPDSAMSCGVTHIPTFVTRCTPTPTCVTGSPNMHGLIQLVIVCYHPNMFQSPPDISGRDQVPTYEMDSDSRYEERHRASFSTTTRPFPLTFATLLSPRTINLTHNAFSPPPDNQQPTVFNSHLHAREPRHQPVRPTNSMRQKR